MSSIEQTLSIIKPDAVERNLQEEIKKNFLENGFTVKDEKKFIFPKLRQRSFIKYISQSHSMESYVTIYHQDQ